MALQFGGEIKNSIRPAYCDGGNSLQGRIDEYVKLPGLILHQDRSLCTFRLAEIENILLRLVAFAPEKKCKNSHDWSHIDESSRRSGR